MQHALAAEHENKRRGGYVSEVDEGDKKNHVPYVTAALLLVLGVLSRTQLRHTGNTQHNTVQRSEHDIRECAYNTTRHG